MRQFVYRLFALLIVSVVCLVAVYSPFVQAAPGDTECSEARLRDLGVAIMSCGETQLSCNLPGTTTAKPGLSAGTSIYILGDSITHAAKPDLEAKIATAGLTVAKINSDPGRAIASDTVGSEPSGLQAVEEDAAIIANAGAIIVALGTNSGIEDLNIQVPALIEKIRGSNASAPIYWVNLFYTSDTGSRDSRNTVISKYSSQLGYTVLDATSIDIELGSDGTHPTPLGSATFAKVIVDSLSTSASVSTNQSTVYDPVSLRFPAFPDKQAVAQALTNYISEKAPSSPWFQIDSDIGTWLVRESEARDINPLLIAAIGKQENGFGTTNSTHVKDYYNYFGMKGSDPIDIPDSAYRGFSSPLEGITFFMDKVKANTQGPDRGLYAEVQNFYDYLGMHQAGAIKYPGESLGTHNGNMDGFDPAMRVYTSWTTSDHPNDVYDGQLFNPGIYYTNSINMINVITGMNLSDTPVRGPTSTGSGANVCQSQNGSSGAVGINGYSFPLAPQKKQSYNTLPCSTSNAITPKPGYEGRLLCHHDGTPAFDLSYPGVTGQSVYAITGGIIDNVKTQEAGWCQSIQLKGSDGYYYWYGHLIDVAVTEGSTVASGQEIAKVATWTEEHTCNGTSGGAHLHIDRGCQINGINQRAGTDSCRDPEFIPFLQAIYESLPS